MKLIHYADKYLEEIRDTKAYDSSDFNRKPRGIWFSVGDGPDGWKAWCDAEEFGCTTHATHLELTSEANVLHLSSLEELKDFTLEYGRDTFRNTDIKIRYIDWGRVAEKYDGIIIAPHLDYMACLDDEIFFWYYGWDCASGCVWNAKAIRIIKENVYV